ncbi:Glucan 1,3-beta-glucosidase [Sparassis crispa]|uniref:Glucan 1,3-beta-glucosidase n=1 Tax=Sparassis crispa TaxID=139825 RepID=A0A401G5Y4_9APHY|nr:Glucan 1,3-beta-glucosidase [Sparassis crispa]GBE77575.1 Glucan 1,3-beta-glucosidase [Sparassis crispa]
MPSSFWRFAPAFALLASRVLADNPISPGFAYGSEKVRGVNLGGWLVLEPWITPSIFDNTGNENIVDEWTFCLYQDTATATGVLQNHWSTWITEQDLADIAAAGLNHVRIPIGYWAFEVGPGEPYIQGQLLYLQDAVAWAGNQGLKVIVDLHGAPGSQNGYDNSGERLSYPGWQSNSTNIQRTDAVIKTIISLFANIPNVVPIVAPLNEPAGYYGDTVLTPLRQYYYDSYGNIRYPYGNSQESNTVVLLHDAFQPLSYWSGFQTAPGWQGVAMDTHIYQMFSDSEVAYSDAQHISAACGMASSLANFDLWLIVGEWTAASTDCATYLNGRGIGARYDGTYSGSTYVGSCSGLTGDATSFSSSYMTFLSQYWSAQVVTWEANTSGWVYWTWKTESADDWSYQVGLQYGWIPSNAANVPYPNICS